MAVAVQAPCQDNGVPAEGASGTLCPETKPRAERIWRTTIDFRTDRYRSAPRCRIARYHADILTSSGPTTTSCYEVPGDAKGKLIVVELHRSGFSARR
jgi:hypothetical protein